VKAPELTKLGLSIFAGTEADLASTNTYATKRFHEEKPRIAAYDPSVKIQRSDLNDDGYQAALLAYLSHLHLDTFNQPVQAFVPWTSRCSGQWELWDKIGDFRYRLYVQQVVDGLRKELFEHKIWTQCDFNPSELSFAICQRLVALSEADLDKGLAVNAMEQLGLSMDGNVDQANEYLREVEELISGLHIRYLR
jgi:hypothetical protein